MKRTVELLVDLKSKNFHEITLKQMDTTQLIFKVLDEGKEIDLTELDVNIIFTKPNNKIVIQEATILDDKIIADLLMNCVRDYGTAKIEVELKKDEETYSSFQLICRIEKTGKDLPPSRK